MTTTDEQRANFLAWQAASTASPEYSTELRRARQREANRRYRAKPENARKGAIYMAAKRAGYTDEEAAEARRKHREEMVRPENQRRTKNRYTLAKYGLTLADYERRYAEMMERQSGLCAACGQPPHGKEPLHLDHHHASGRLRALLCANCNRALGILQEDPKRIAALLAYVEHHC